MCTQVIDLQEIEFQSEQRNKRLIDITVGPLSTQKNVGPCVSSYQHNEKVVGHLGYVATRQLLLFPGKYDQTKIHMIHIRFEQRNKNNKYRSVSFHDYLLPFLSSSCQFYKGEVLYVGGKIQLPKLHKS